MAGKKGYPKMHVIDGDTEQVHEEREVKKMNPISRTPGKQRNLLCTDIFKGTTVKGDPVRVVLTKGVAGVGKSVLIQKFSLEWAEGNANQDIQLLFHFTFKELNALKDTEWSLVGLLHHHFKESQKLFSFQCIKVLFIFDGLDECRLPLDFSQTRVLDDPTESASVEVLLVNLIRGDLSPSSRIWITTRPWAASKIPKEYVCTVSEVQGFNDEQKEDYFMKRFKDKRRARAIISHIKNIRTLNIMSRIPIFCWIIATVLQHTEKSELPKTMTEFYVKFLLMQAKIRNIEF